MRHFWAVYGCPQPMVVADLYRAIPVGNLLETKRVVVLSRNVDARAESLSMDVIVLGNCIESFLKRQCMQVTVRQLRVAPRFGLA